MLQDNLNVIWATPSEGYRKLCLMKQAEKFGRPVVTLSIRQVLISVGAEENEDKGEAIARNLMEMSDLKFRLSRLSSEKVVLSGALALA